jgi:predicted transcriptional regulator
MSPRAAWRLESFGFAQVFDYPAGKLDWFANGLPRVGKRASLPRAADAVRRDTPQCRLTDHLEDVRGQVQAAGQDAYVVVNDAGIVLGFLGREALKSIPTASVAGAMDPGPTTIRPHMMLTEVPKYMHKQAMDRILVTTAEGRFVGILYRQDAEQILDERKIKASRFGIEEKYGGKFEQLIRY